MRGNPKISIRVSQDQLQQLKAAAAAEQTSVSEYLRGIIAMHFKGKK